YGWSSLAPGSPNVTGLAGYAARFPDANISVESWGTGALSVPLHARLGEYIRNFELPLWNPYQGLGEPYAAQGDGSPYSPLELLRAMLPYSFGNLITFIGYY